LYTRVRRGLNSGNLRVGVNCDSSASRADDSEVDSARGVTVVVTVGTGRGLSAKSRECYGRNVFPLKDLVPNLRYGWPMES